MGKQRWVRGAVLALALLLLAGCAPSTQPPQTALQTAAPTATPEREAVLTVCLGDEPDSLDPQLAGETGERALARLLYEGLTRPDNSGGWTMGAAESYVLSENGKTCTLTLRKDALWSDGVPVQAEDFVRAMERLLTPESESPYVMDVAMWVEGGEARVYGDDQAELGVRALDERTLEIRLVARCPYLEAFLALPVFAPLRDEEGTWTNGAFRVEAEEEDCLVLRRSETYWDAEAVAPDTVEVRFYGSEAEAVRALRAGELDVCLSYPDEELDELRQEGFVRESTEATTLYVDMNPKAAPFDDPLVRKAFALAVDARAVLQAAEVPGAVPADALTPPGIAEGETSFYVPGRQGFAPQEERTEEARALLAQAGYPGGEGFPEVAFLVTEQEADTGLADALCRAWEEGLGVRVHAVEGERLEVLDDRFAGKFQMARGTFFNVYGDAQALWDMENRLLQSVRESEALSAALEDVYRAGDEQERFEALHRIEEIALDEAVCIPVYFFRYVWLCQPDIAGATYVPAGDLLLQGAHREAQK